ncbi:unnamed protein product [Malus baccata var. baccata]
MDRDLDDVHSSHDDASVIKVQISNAMVSHVLVDNRYGVNILFKDAMERIRILDNINKSKITLHSFNITHVRSLKRVRLVVQAEP